MGRRGCCIVLAAIASAVPAQAQAAVRSTPTLANRCFVVASVARARYVGPNYRANTRSRRRALRFFLKPTGIGTYMLYDRGAGLLSVGEGSTTGRANAPSPAAEWAPKRRSKGSLSLRSTSNGRFLAASRRSSKLVTTTGGARARLFRFTRTRGCRRYPEAALNATGKPSKGKRRDGSVFGYADPHLHVPAALRAGGLTIAGDNFHRFGIQEALGRDAEVHGSDGSLDFTGNLLRSGEPTGTHDTHGWPSFAGWPVHDTYTHQQVYYRWLERAWMGGLKLLVAQTVEDESLCNIEPRKSHSCDETATVELEIKQLRALQDYIDAQSGGRGRGWFRLVFDSRAARRAIERGKLAVIVGVETSGPFGCSEFQGQPKCDRADIDRGIGRLRKAGVRAMFVAHWTDNALAGAALEGGDKGSFIAALNLSQTGHPFSTGPCPYPQQGEEAQPPSPVIGPVSGQAPVTGAGGGRQCNTKGLTALGEYAVRRLMDNHMLIEVDHLSEWARQRVLTIAEQRHYPLVSSHTGSGGLWVPEELRRLYALGGFASARVDDAAKLPAAILAFRRYGAGVGVGLGTDTGGFNALPGPDPAAAKRPLHYPFRSFGGKVRFGRQRSGRRSFDVNRDGVAHYGLMPDLLADVRRKKNGRQALALLFGSAGAYVDTWKRAGG